MIHRGQLSTGNPQSFMDIMSVADGKINRVRGFSAYETGTSYILRGYARRMARSRRSGARGRPVFWLPKFRQFRLALSPP